MLRVAFSELSRRRHQLRSVSGPEFEDLRTRPPTTRSSTFWAGWVSSADSAASPLGFTSSSCSRSLPKSRGTRGADSHPARRSSPGTNCPTLWHPGPRTGSSSERDSTRCRSAIGELTDRQREVFVAIALNDGSIDVLALKLDTNRNAIYKNLFDARRRLRAKMAAAGHPVSDATASGIAASGNARLDHRAGRRRRLLGPPRRRTPTRWFRARVVASYARILSLKAQYADG